MADKDQDAFETFDIDLPPVRGFPELRWTGKRPFSSTQFFPAQRKEAYGDSVSGWMNGLYWGDNIQVMSHLLRDHRGQVDLVYIDPPFDSKADYKRTISVRGDKTLNDHSAFEEKQYSDIWNNENYTQFMYERFCLIRELMSETATAVFHFGPNISHYMKVVLDEVFGVERFINDVVWRRSFGHSDSEKFGVIHDNLLIYSKTKKRTWNTVLVDPDPDYVEQFFDTYDAERDEKYQRLSLSAGGLSGGGYDYEYKGVRTLWRCPVETLTKHDEAGRLHWPKKKGGVPRLKRYVSEYPGMPAQDIWTDINKLHNQSNEAVGYPTQKPESLLERVIRATSNEGDLVFDCFSGSGTTLSAAVKLGRRFIGADINLGAIETTTARLNGLRHDAEEGRGLFDLDSSSNIYTGFEVYNVNNYDIFRNPVEAKELIKEAMELQPLPTSSVFDGQRDQHLVKIMPVNRIATRADLNEVINGMDFKAYERRQAEAPSKIVDRIMLVCMGHEPDIGPELVKAAKPFNIEVEVVDLIRDKTNLHFKRQSDAKLVIKDGHLEIAGFYPLNLLQKLSMDTDAVDDWRQLVETIKVDWNYDGAVLSPELIDAPDKNELVTGRYPIPDDASTIRVKITDLLSESWEGEIDHG